jgi:HEPN domain-containing protein
MVLSVFASELYLKCLLCVENDSVPNSHNLKLLFEKLEVKTRHELGRVLINRGDAV